MPLSSSPVLYDRQDQLKVGPDFLNPDDALFNGNN